MLQLASLFRWKPSFLGARLVTAAELSLIDGDDNEKIELLV